MRKSRIKETHRFFWILLAAGIAAGVAGAAVPSAAYGQSLSLPGLNGGTLDEAELNQGVVITVFWASWSPKCRNIVERVNALEARWGKRARVITVVFQEDAPTVKKFLSGKAIKVPVFLDRSGALSKKYAVTHLPGLLIVKDGRGAFRGKLPLDPDTLIEQSIG